MPRPLRIEFEDACYHVMNRGRGRQRIFHAKAYYDAFLTTLAEAHRRFGAILHAYCLMDNHYHLLLQTPNANVSRIMRHINGLYTQRYNRLKRTGGPLFRGRFKAILVERKKVSGTVFLTHKRLPVSLQALWADPSASAKRRQRSSLPRPIQVLYRSNRPLPSNGLSVGRDENGSNLCFIVRDEILTRC